MRSSRSGHKEHSTPTRAAKPTHHHTLAHHCYFYYHALSIVAAATAGCRLPDCPARTLHSPVLQTPGPDWTGNWRAGWLAGWLTGGMEGAGQGEVGWTDGWMDGLSPPLGTHDGDSVRCN